jgi:CRP-like cAMP-binding protein
MNSTNEPDQHILEFKKYIQRFLSMPDEDWNLLVPYIKEKKLQKQEHLIKEGKVCNEIGFLLQGCMRHYYTREGDEKTTYFYFENNLVSSYFSCITGQPSQLSIEALSDCNLLVFPYNILQQLFKKSHAWEKFGRLIAEYIAIGLEERMVGLLTLSPEERYEQLLKSNKQKIIERVPQHYIANYLGITPVSLSRIRSRLAK